MTSTRLTSEQIDLVQSSFAKIVPIADLVAELFYKRLFEIAPEVKPLFHDDLRNQGRKLMATLSLVVGSLRNFDAVMPAVKALAVKQLGYGVVQSHYAHAGEAMIWTLEKGLGDGFSAETKRAWLATCAALSDAMIAEAHDARVAA